MGRFITIEGGEGVGKTVFTNGLVAALKQRSISFLRTFEPGGTPTGVKLRELFMQPPADDPPLIETEFCIVSAARAQHVGTKVKPALEAGQWVVCDRFADSSRVYQGVCGGIATKALEDVIALTTFGLEPDVTFLLDCDTDVSMERIGKRSAGEEEANRYDGGDRQMHETIRQGFLGLCERFPARMVRLDAAAAPEVVLEQALVVLRERFDL